LALRRHAQDLDWGARGHKKDEGGLLLVEEKRKHLAPLGADGARGSCLRHPSASTRSPAAAPESASAAQPPIPVPSTRE
jgi:hypothetical protein